MPSTVSHNLMYKPRGMPRIASPRRQRSSVTNARSKVDCFRIRIPDHVRILLNRRRAIDVRRDQFCRILHAIAVEKALPQHNSALQPATTPLPCAHAPLPRAPLHQLFASAQTCQHFSSNLSRSVSSANPTSAFSVNHAGLFLPPRCLAVAWSLLPIRGA